MAHDELRVLPGTALDLTTVATTSAAVTDDDKEAGEERLKDLAKELRDFQEVFYADGSQRLLVVLQAMDTAGKDSTIRDVFGRMNPQGVRVTSFKSPTPRELAHDFLWRVHPNVPGDGQIGIFNRSHYEDVLIVRVDDIVPEARWRKRYGQIREFEELLVEEGTTIVKFFIHISKEEQKERLQARLDEADKHWKFHTSDLETRKKWDNYMAAYSEAISETSTQGAPWYVIPGDRKWHRKVLIAEIMVDLMAGMDLSFPEPEDLEGIVID